MDAEGLRRMLSEDRVEAAMRAVDKGNVSCAAVAATAVQQGAASMWRGRERAAVYVY